MPNSIQELRIDYQRGALDEANTDPNPFVMFQRWLDDAIAENLSEPNAMILATAALDGKPSARVMLLRNLDERGFVFFTNYSSRKGKEIAQNPFAALVFFLAAAASPNSRRRTHRTRIGARIRRVFRFAPARQSIERGGIPAKSGHSRPRIFGSARAGIGQALSQKGLASPALGRLSCRTGCNRILART